MRPNVQFVKKSSNAKTGPIPTTTSPRSTCPSECPLSGKGGCYAEAGYYTRLNWDKVDSGERGGPWEAFLASVRKLPEGQLWRHNVAGDLPPDEQGRISGPALWDITAANSGRKGFTYTHYSPQDSHNVDMIRAANDGGFTVNVSANSPAEASALHESLGLPTVTIVPSDFWGGSEGHARRGNIVRCPAEYREDISCATCQLCQRRDRRDIVGFTVHGTQAKSADVIARG